MRLPFVCILASLCGALVLDTRATAQDTAPHRQTSTFWREVREPGYARSQELIEQGQHFLASLGGADPAEPMANAALRSAILRFEHAITLAPRSRQAWFYLAFSLSRFERYDPQEDAIIRRDDEAIAAYEHLQELDPMHRVEEVGFELGILNTRVRRFDLAITEYQRSIRYALTRVNTAVTFSNMAEVRMMSGDLVGAVRDYERAVHLARQGNSPDALGLPLFGLAVALDRLGETNEAQARAVDAVGIGLGIAILRRPGVFFEPAAEIHYYEALGHRAIAEGAHVGGEERVAALSASLRSWRTYLALAADDDPWRDIVLLRIETARTELEAAQPSSPRSRTSRLSGRLPPR